MLGFLPQRKHGKSIPDDLNISMKGTTIKDLEINIEYLYDLRVGKDFLRDRKV